MLQQNITQYDTTFLQKTTSINQNPSQKEKVVEIIQEGMARMPY